MDMQAETSGLDPSWVPIEAALFVPQAAHSEKTENPEFTELKGYLSERLLQGSAETLRERIDLVLEDDRYHELISKVSDRIPFRAVVEDLVEDDGEGETQVREGIPEDLLPKFVRLAGLQTHVLHGFIAFLESQSKTKKKRRTKRAAKTERLGFMREAYPVTIKRALLAMWVAPMCSYALSAIDLTDASNRKIVEPLLDLAIETHEQQVAFFLALGFGQEPPEDVLPASRRFSLADAYGRWMIGMGHTLTHMAAKPALRQSGEPSERKSAAG
jgi:hypothetical protein